MRYHEIASGLRLPINGEEAMLLHQIEKQPVSKSSLDDRQQEMARLMVSRGLLNQYKKNDDTYYRASSVTDIWRDLYDY